MKDRNWWVIIGIILLIAFVLVYLGSRNDADDADDVVTVPVTPTVAVEGSTVCTSEQKAAEVCTFDYSATCGDDGVTYSNPCVACSSGNIDSYTPGECS